MKNVCSWQKKVSLWIRPLIKFYIQIRKTANRVCVESKGCRCSLRTNVSKLRFYKLQMESWSQIRSTINNISIKIGQSRFGKRGKKGESHLSSTKESVNPPLLKKKQNKPNHQSINRSIDLSTWQSWQTHGASFSARRGRKQVGHMKWKHWSDPSELPGFVKLQVCRRSSPTLLIGRELIKGPLTWNSAGALKQTPQKTKLTDYFSATDLLFFVF